MQNNDKSSILPNYIDIYDTNNIFILWHKTGHDIDAKIL